MAVWTLTSLNTLPIFQPYFLYAIASLNIISGTWRWAGFAHQRVISKLDCSWSHRPVPGHWWRGFSGTVVDKWGRLPRKTIQDWEKLWREACSLLRQRIVRYVRIELHEMILLAAIVVCDASWIIMWRISGFIRCTGKPWTRTSLWRDLCWTDCRWLHGRTRHLWIVPRPLWAVDELGAGCISASYYRR
jgi:hypothetical protein